ncbi:MAG TPA: AraC family transcriptional regulator [Prolixibacteraceae bacterium]|nr:AraC family transcriptional regulator [Prolixibacteraceae bacterium]
MAGTLGISVLILAYFLSIKDFSLFPDKNFQYLVYNDHSIDGNSQINDFVVTDSLIKLDFKLNDAIKSPYIGVCMAPRNGKPFHLTHQNLVRIKVRSNGIHNLGLNLYESNFTPNDNKPTNEVVFYTTVAISSQLSTYTIPIRRFEVPYWWFELNNQRNNKPLKPGLKNIVCLNICNAYTPKIDENKSLELYAITFTRDNKPLILFLLAINLFVVAFSFISIFIIEKVRSRKSAVTITYKPIEIKNEIASNFDMVEYINRNFQKGELTLEMVSEETGISQRKITNYIQHHFACNFKTYLNRLRINESKRLLVETGLNIGEIAYKVGFNNQSHFNRVFKMEMNSSPSEFREKNTK